MNTIKTWEERAAENAIMGVTRDAKIAMQAEIADLRAELDAIRAQEPASQIKDHEVAALVNRLRDIATTYRDTQQLRERIANEIRRLAVNSKGGVKRWQNV